MAPWDELVLACNLKVDAPQQVIDVLKILCLPTRIASSSSHEPTGYEEFIAPNHPFFVDNEDNWDTLLIMDTNYFPGDPFGKLTYDEYAKCYKFTARAMVRHGGFVIAAFLHWLAPYSQTEGIVGYTRCDETASYIEFIYFENGVTYYKGGDFSENSLRLRRRSIAADGATYEEAD